MLYFKRKANQGMVIGRCVIYVSDDVALTIDAPPDVQVSMLEKHIVSDYLKDESIHDILGREGKQLTVRGKVEDVS